MGRIVAEAGDLQHGFAERVPFDSHLTSACKDNNNPAGAAKIIRTPYLQKTQHNSTSLLWVSVESTSESVLITKPDGTIVTKVPGIHDASAQPSKGKQWIANVEGLHPYTIYCYALYRGNRPVTPRTGFRTAPKPGSQTPVRIVTLGDLGTRSFDQFAVLSQMATVVFDLAIINGDVAYHSGRLQEIRKKLF